MAQVPTYDMDLFWHTHLGCSQQYVQDCEQQARLALNSLLLTALTHSAVLCLTVSYLVVLCRTLPCSVGRYSTVLCRILSCSVVHCRTLPYA